LVIVTLHKQFDAAYPPASAPPGCTVAAGYIGGSEAVNVWTPAEWLRFQALYQVPIWVPDTDADPQAEAIEACAASRTLGWAPHDANRRLIVFDLELAEVPAWYAAVVWSADWDGDYALDPGQAIEATQYAADIAWENTQVDYSAVSDWWTAHCGIGPRWS
jgi:hypothetical protein